MPSRSNNYIASGPIFVFSSSRPTAYDCQSPPSESPSESTRNRQDYSDDAQQQLCRCRDRWGTQRPIIYPPGIAVKDLFLPKPNRRLIPIRLIERGKDPQKQRAVPGDDFARNRNKKKTGGSGFYRRNGPVPPTDAMIPKSKRHPQIEWIGGNRTGEVHCALGDTAVPSRWSAPRWCLATAIAFPYREAFCRRGRMLRSSGAPSVANVWSNPGPGIERPAEGVSFKFPFFPDEGNCRWR